MKLKPLNRKETRTILEQVGKEYGCDAKALLIDKYSFFISEKNKIYIIDNIIKDISFSNIRVNSFGLYFAELNYGNIRLSMEGSFIIGKIATKNIFEVDAKKARQWLKGFDIEIDIEFQGFVIIKHKDDFLGSGKYKQGKILNFIPKPRRIKE